MSKSRRQFLKTSAATGSAFTVPMIWNRAQGATQDANDRLTVASIGVGGSRGRYNRGGSIAGQASQLGQMIAVCDVDGKHNDEFNSKHGGELQMFTDYRELLEKTSPDVVTIGTPDHWHIPIAIAALR